MNGSSNGGSGDGGGGGDGGGSRSTEIEHKCEKESAGKIISREEKHENSIWSLIRGQTEMESKTNLVGKMVILKYAYILKIYLDGSSKHIFVFVSFVSKPTTE